MNPKTLIFEDLQDKTKDLFEWIDWQSQVFDVSKRELLKEIIKTTRKEMIKND